MFYFLRKSKGKMDLTFSKQVKSKVKITDEKSVEHFFMANSADNSLTLYHILFHTLFIIALSAIFKNKELAIFLAIAGVIAGIVSLFTFLRADGFRKFWLENMDSELIERMNESMKFKFLRHSRIITIVILIIVYVGFLTNLIFNK